MKDENDPRFVIAKGNGIDVTTKSLNDFITNRYSSDVLTNTVVKNALMKHLVQYTLIMNAAQKYADQVSTQDVDNEVAKLLKIQGSMEGLKRYYRAGGFTDDVYKETRDYLLRKKLFDDFAAKNNATSISDKEVDDFYEKNPLYQPHPESYELNYMVIHVYPTDSKKTKESKEKVMESARTQLANGGDFLKIANAFSDEKPVLDLDGKVKPAVWVKGKVEADLYKKVGELNPFVISPVIVTKHGFYVVKVLKKNPENNTAPNLMKNNIRENLLMMKKMNSETSLVHQLIEQAHIQSDFKQPSFE